MADGPGAGQPLNQPAPRSSLVPVSLLLALASLSSAVRAAGFGNGVIPYQQVALLLVAIALTWLFWRLVSKRREQEAVLHGHIREREARLNLALWGSGDEFWDWNIRDNSLYRLGAIQLLGQGSLETLSTRKLRSLLALEMETNLPGNAACSSTSTRASGWSGSQRCNCGEVDS